MSRPHGKAVVDTSHPEPFAVCDRCGFWYNLPKLSFQYEWAGTTQVRLGQLVCERCYDTPQEQLRSLQLPADPPPVPNARTEPFSLDETEVIG